jgi:hypothetical protein
MEQWRWGNTSAECLEIDMKESSIPADLDISSEIFLEKTSMALIVGEKEW